MTETPDGTDAPETPAVPAPASAPDPVSVPETAEDAPEQTVTETTVTEETAVAATGAPAAEQPSPAAQDIAPTTQATPASEAVPAAEAAPATDAGPAADVASGAEDSAEPAQASTAGPTAEGAPSAEAVPTAEGTPATEDGPAHPATPAADTPAAEAPAAPEKPVVPEAPAVPEVPAVSEVPAASEALAAPEAPATPAPSPAAQTSPDAPAPAPAPAPKPRPTPGPRPTPKAMPKARPAGAAPAGPASAPAPAISIPVPDEAAALAEAAKFGRVAEDGSVFVIEDGVERLVGQVPGVSADEALGLYLRRFLDLQAKTSLFETRLGSAEMNIKEIDQTLKNLNEEAAEPAAVGDLVGLRAKLDTLAEAAKERRAQLEADRAATRAKAVEERTKIVEAAEAIANTDATKIQWRPSGDQLRSLLDQWKNAQRSGPRIDRPTEEALWKRFSHARTAFDRERRHFFAQLEQSNAAAKEAKEKLVVEAEQLSSSTQWGPTAGAYRDLMTRWKAAGRANRKDDDALWARFRAAQDTFFNARDAENAATDAAYGENLVVKEAILAEAEKLLPVQNLARAKNALRDLQDQWEAAGKVPRGDIQRVEGRMRAVETAIRDAEDSAWKRKNPETQARAEGAATQLEASIDQDQGDLADAQVKGDKRRIKELESALAAKNSWLEQIVKAAEDARGEPHGRG